MSCSECGGLCRGEVLLADFEKLATEENRTENTHVYKIVYKVGMY